MNALLTWQDNSNDEDGFIVEQSFNGGQMQEVVRLGANAASASISVANPSPGNHQYTFQVRAFNSAGSSSPSNQGSITTPPVINVPAGPSGLIVQLVIS